MTNRRDPEKLHRSDGIWNRIRNTGKYLFKLPAKYLEIFRDCIPETYPG
jgi:hypothetical protein